MRTSVSLGVVVIALALPHPTRYAEVVARLRADPFVAVPASVSTPPETVVELICAMRESSAKESLNVLVAIGEKVRTDKWLNRSIAKVPVVVWSFTTVR